MKTMREKEVDREIRRMRAQYEKWIEVLGLDPKPMLDEWDAADQLAQWQLYDDLKGAVRDDRNQGLRR